MPLSPPDRLCHHNTGIIHLDTPNTHHRITPTSTKGAEVRHTSPARHRRGIPIIMTCIGEVVVQEEEDPDQVALLCKVSRSRRCHHSNNSNNTHLIITTILILISTHLRHIKIHLGMVLLRIKGRLRLVLVLVGRSTTDVVDNRILQEDSGRPRHRGPGRVIDTLHILREIITTLDLPHLTRDTPRLRRYRTDPRCRTIQTFHPDLSLRWARFLHGKAIRGPEMAEGAITWTIGGHWTHLINLAAAAVQKGRPRVD